MGSKRIELDVHSASEAIRAILIQRPDFEGIIRDGAFTLIRQNFPDYRGGRIPAARLRAELADETCQLDEDMLKLGLGASDLHVIPAVTGAGGRGLGKILIGVALVAGAWIAAPAIMSGIGAGAAATGAHAIGATAFSLLGMNVTFGNLALIGGMIALQGVSQVLAKAPAASDAKKDDSYIFTGASNVGVQGDVLPLVYGGPIRVGSVPISSGVSNTRYGGSGTMFAWNGGSLIGEYIDTSF